MVTQSGSGGAASSHTARGSVKDRLGPTGQGGRERLPGGSPPRRRLFTPSSSRSQAKRYREESSHGYSELSKQQKIQKVKDALDTLRSQQEEWAVELAELEKQEEVQHVRKSRSHARHTGLEKQEEVHPVRKESRMEVSSSRALTDDGRRRVPNRARDVRTEEESTHSSPAQYREGRQGGSVVSRGGIGRTEPKGKAI